jgi:hypothetical protein
MQEMDEVKGNDFCDRDHVFVLVDSQFKKPGCNSDCTKEKAIDMLGRFFIPDCHDTAKVTMLQWQRAILESNISKLSDDTFYKKCEIVPVNGMGSGVICTKIIEACEVTAVYRGKIATRTYFNFARSDSEYSVAIHLRLLGGIQHHLVLIGDPNITGPAAMYNDCRFSAATTRKATPKDLERMNIQLVQTNVFGYPLVVVMATKRINPGTMMLLDYGKTFW